VTDSVYQSDPNQAPDSAFLPGEPRHLVVGNHGRLLDPRRTPVHVTGVLPGSGFFEVQIDAFEDAGTRWLIPLEEVTSYQFADGGAIAGPDAERQLHAAIAQHDVTVTVTAGEVARLRTAGRLDAETSRAAEWLTSVGAPVRFDPVPLTGEGWPAAASWFDRYLSQRDLAQMEERFASAYVSNPWSGDLVLGHLTVIAELGLGSLTARAIRDRNCFSGRWTRERRADHILARIGFVRALWARADGDITLHRGVATQADTTARPRRGRSPLVSASFSRDVAKSHFGSSAAVAGALYRQRLQPERLFMTFLETKAMNGIYKEAEALLLADGGVFF
jgi:hypothetical protein